MRTYSQAPHWWEWESRAVPARVRRPAYGRLIWKFGWGLLFVCVMTILSEYGPHIGFRKFADQAAPIISHSFIHAVK